MEGVFVCEGDFTASQQMRFQVDSKFQVVAGGNVNFNNVSWAFDWITFLDPGETSFFFWSGNDAFIDLGMFADQNLQVTAVHDINVYSSDSLWSAPNVNYRSPDVDVAGFPVDMTVSDWKELPSE